MPFTSECKLKLINDTWVMLTEDLLFCSKWFGKMIKVKSGFVTDFASVPRLPVIYMLLGGRGKRPAAVHDDGYAKQEMPKRQVDLLFLEGLFDTFVADAWKEFCSSEVVWKEWKLFMRVQWRMLLSLLMYVGVVFGGWWTWLKYKRRKKKGLPIRPEAPDVYDDRWEDRVY